MTHIALLVTVVLTSLLRWTAAEASILCTWTKVLPNEEVHYNFLRQDSSSLRLYHSVWSEERTLLSCSWSNDADVIHNYFSLCRERTQEFSDHPDGNLNLNFMLEGEDQCVSLLSPGVAGDGERTGKRPVRSVDGLPAATNSQGQDERSEVRIHQRVKRGFIVPGTLWCGSGNKAPSYEDLGVFTDTDSCCREHDQCKHTILSFDSEFGVFNSNIFTMSHCECDNKFRNCLMEANDSISHAVGYTFFNLLKMHCFEFSHRLQCTQRNWFGMCKESKMALYAEVHPPMLFEYTSPTEVSMNSTSSIINTTTPAELQGSSMSEPQFFFITVPTPSTSSPSASITADAATVPTPSTSSPSASITADAATVPTPSTNSPSASITAGASTVPTPSTSSPPASITADASTVPTPSTSSPSASITAGASTVPTPSTSLPSASITAGASTVPTPSTSSPSASITADASTVPTPSTSLPSASITADASTVPTPSTSLPSTSITAGASTVPTPLTLSPSASITADASTVPTPSTSLPSTSITSDTSTVPTPLTNSPSTFITSDASTVPTPLTSSLSTSIIPVTNVTTSTIANTSGRPTGSATERTDNLENTLQTKIQTPTEHDADITGKLLTCGIYKDLDKCRNKIPPYENRYGLQNPEPRTLYHCNCTTRLFQTLAEQTRLTEVQALLLEHVSQSCFLPQDCTEGKICTAVLVKAEFPPVEQRSGAEVEEQHHLQAVKQKVRRPKASRAKRKDRAVRLHKQCLRMIRRKMNKTRNAGRNAQRQAVTGRELV